MFVHPRNIPRGRVAELRFSKRLVLSAVGLVASALFACVDGSRTQGPNGAVGTGGGASGADGTSSGASGTGGSSVGTGPVVGGITEGALPYFNQCGVAAPLPAASDCMAVSAPAIANFDDYAAGSAADYRFYLNAAPAAPEAVAGAIQHVGDGSDTAGGTSVIATEMVPGVDNAGHALQFSNTNAANWGGLLMLYFPSGGTSTGCVDASAYTGLEFSIKGSSPTRKFGVSVNMLDTIPPTDGGTCSNTTAEDCKNATLELALPADPETWMRVRVPWGALTPGVGSDRSCVPVSGQNILRLVFQPFMNYPPPDYMFEPGPYRIAIDDLAFYVDPNATNTPLPSLGATCDLAPSIQWTASEQLISPVSDAAHDLLAVKDPTVVRFNDRWHVYASSVSTAGAYNMVYTSFADFSEAASAPLYYLDQTPGFNTYTAAPQLFYFTPQNKWYLVFQSGPPMYSTANDPGDPTGWTAPAPFFATTPAIITNNGGGWLDYWVICDTTSCHLFFSSNQGHYYRSKTAIADFPNGFGEPEIVMREANSGRLFEGSNVYKMNGTNRYLLLVEAFDQTSDNRRYYRSWIAESLDGPWQPYHGSGSFPFAGPRNVTFEAIAWTNDISHGEMIRAGYDETLAIEPCNARYLFQGTDPMADSGGDYNKIPWRIGLLTQAP